jgi:hypothetical protein
MTESLFSFFSFVLTFLGLLQWQSQVFCQKNFTHISSLKITEMNILNEKNFSQSILNCRPRKIERTDDSDQWKSTHAQQKVNFKLRSFYEE